MIIINIKTYEEDKPQVEEKKDSDSPSTKGALPKGWKPEK